ncbi:MAG: sialidase family protein, partial [Acidimicrobiales bacterium]
MTVVAATIAGVLAFPALASADSGVPPATFGAQGLKVSRLTAAEQMTKDDPVPGRAFSSPVMLADPDNPRVIVAAIAELRTRVCYLARSTNAGKSWHILPALPAPPSYPYCTNTFGGAPQAELAWGRDHTLYYALSGFDNADGGENRVSNYSVLLARSTDLGNTWTTSLVTNNRGKTGANVTFDAPVLSVAVDTSGLQDTVYVGFQEGHPGATPAPPSASMVATSTDGGKTFSPPVNINQFANTTVVVNGTAYPVQMRAPFLAVSSSGTVVAVSGPNSVSTNPIPGSPNEPMMTARSTDQGKTWTVEVLSPPTQFIRGPVIQAGLGWTPEGGPLGTFVTAYQAAPNRAAGESDIDAQYSSDGGVTWSAPVRINDDNQAQEYLSFLPY